MPNLDAMRIREWQNLAARVAAEPDPDKVIDLAKELITALDERTNDSLTQVPPESKTNEQDPA